MTWEEVVATGRKRCRNRRLQYTRLRYTFTEDSPFPDDSPGSTDPYGRWRCQDGCPPPNY